MTATRSFAENTSTVMNLGAGFLAMDPDADTLDYTFSGPDTSSFSFDSATGLLKTRSGVDYDYENKPSYSVVISVRDSLDAAGDDDSSDDSSVAVTINLTNVEEPGDARITGMLSGGSTLTGGLTDPDGDITNKSYQWMRSDSANGPFSNITSNGTSETYVLVAADVGKYLKVEVSYTDGEGPGKSAASMATGAIGASNAEPTFDDGDMAITRSLPENSGASADVQGVAASDDDNDTLTYSLSSTDAGLFEIDASGQLKTKTGVTHNFNFESTKKRYTVVVNVTDGKDAAGFASNADDDMITVHIDLTDINEAPTITTTQTGTTFAEHQPTTTAIATFAASDLDASTTLEWSVESADDGGKFNISSSTGVLTFKASPNFEMPTDAGMDNVYNLTVKVTDNGSPAMSDTHDYAVTVTNVNEAPVITSTGSAHTAPAVNENTPAATIIATYTATDVDANSTLAWSLEGEDANDFTITKNIMTGNGELKFKASPNFEMPADEDADDTDGEMPDNVYDVTVKVVDDHTPQGSATLDVSVTVNDLNETPVISGIATRSFAEIEYPLLAPSNRDVATYTAYDDDPDDTITWDLSGTDADHFSISATGVLSFAPRSATNRIDFENPDDHGSNNVYDIVIEADDGQGELNSVGRLRRDREGDRRRRDARDQRERHHQCHGDRVGRHHCSPRNRGLHRTRRGGRDHHLVPLRRRRGRLHDREGHSHRERRALLPSGAQLRDADGYSCRGGRPHGQYLRDHRAGD